MMIRAFILLLAVLAGGWFVADSMKHLGPGYVLVYFNHYSLETSIWVGSLLLFIAVLLCYVLIRLVMRVLQLSSMTWSWRSNRKRLWLGQSISAFLQGNYADAERFALRNGQFEDYILAARAALMAENAERARELVKKAAMAEGVDAFALGLLHYDVAVYQEQNQEAKQLLERLIEQKPQHIAVLKRAVDYYLLHQQPENLLKLLPTLQKKQKSPHQSLQKVLIAKSVKSLFAYAMQQNNEQQLQQIWHDASKTTARNDVLADYCMALIAMKKEAEAEKLLFKRLRSTFDQRCLMPYAKLSFNTKEQLDYLQTLDQQHPYNAQLQLALAVVLMKDKQWDEAKHVLDKSLQIQESKEGYQQLALYYQQKHQLGLAQQSLHKALAMC